MGAFKNKLIALKWIKFVLAKSGTLLYFLYSKLSRGPWDDDVANLCAKL